ncbi:hypothetical protein Leryth_018408 [Lithospermum erythrorhizon]|nr:hypothetical protein Leryth_018408 [Lithospermum erythrorhizon]
MLICEKFGEINMLGKLGSVVQIEAICCSLNGSYGQCEIHDSESRSGRIQTQPSKLNLKESKMRRQLLKSY